MAESNDKRDTATPRTDAVAAQFFVSYEDLARQLERELVEVNERFDKERKSTLSLIGLLEQEKRRVAALQPVPSAIAAPAAKRSPESIWRIYDEARKVAVGEAPFANPSVYHRTGLVHVYEAGVREGKSVTPEAREADEQRKKMDELQSRIAPDDERLAG